MQNSTPAPLKEAPLKEALSADTAAPADMVVLGKVTGVYGLQGALKVFPFSGDPDTLGALKTWWIGKDENDFRAWQPIECLRVRADGALLKVTLAKVSDRNTAESLQGYFVGVPHQDLPPTADNEYYWGDLIGLSVINTENECLGTVLGLIETPANAVLRVGMPESPERLLPFVGAIVIDVNLSARIIRVDWGKDW